MTIEHKTNWKGETSFILITDIVDNQFIKEKFIGYSEKEAVRIFKRILKEKRGK